MHLQFVGCGDAFGSGGQMNTCLHVVGATANFLVDCGASSMIALRRLGIAPNDIDIILVTHFHADHFGGIPFFILHASLVAKRDRPLTIAGPPGLPDRYAQAMNVAFPGFPPDRQRFALTLQEIAPDTTETVGALTVQSFPVRHAEPAGPCVGYRISVEGRVVAYSGDTEWVDNLIPMAKEADLFVCEAYTAEKPVTGHNAYKTLEAHLDAIGAKRTVITHMSDDMLARRAEARCLTATDGMVVAL